MTPTQPPSTSDGRHQHDDPRPPDIGSGANRLLVLLGAVGIYVAGSVGPSVVSLAEIVTSRVSYVDACHIVIVLLLLSVLALLARDFVPASVRQQLKARLFKVVMSCHLHLPTPASRCSSESASFHTIASDAPPATDAPRSNSSTAPNAAASDVMSCHLQPPTPASRCSSDSASFHSEASVARCVAPNAVEDELVRRAMAAVAVENVAVRAESDSESGVDGASKATTASRNQFARVGVSANVPRMGLLAKGSCLGRSLARALT